MKLNIMKPLGFVVPAMLATMGVVQAQDCTEFQETMTIDTPTPMTFRYTADVDAGLLRGELTVANEGWLSFAVSETGTMLGAHAIMGFPDEGSVERRLLSGFTPAEIVLLDNQDGLDASIEQDGGETVLTFEVSLEDPNDATQSINPDGVNNFLFAAGPSNELEYHGLMRLGVEVTLTPCGGGGGDAMPEDNGMADEEPADNGMADDPTDAPANIMDNEDAVEITDPSTVMVGDAITYEGFVMDQFCIEQGVFLDLPEVPSLANPDKHTVHCLIDAPPCIASPYELLMDPPAGSPDGTNFTRAYTLDDASKEMVVALAKEIGVCSECANTGHLQAGFRVRLTAEVTALGDPMVGNGPVISVSQLDAVFPFVGQGIEVEGFVSDQFCLQAGVFLDTGLPSLEQPEKHTLHCLLDPPPCLESPFEVLLPPAEGETEYVRGYTLDDASKDLLIGIARMVGVCDTCSGNGTLEEGFRAKITGTIVNAERDLEAGSGPVISASNAEAVLPADTEEEPEIEVEADAGACDTSSGRQVFEAIPISFTYEIGTDEASGQGTFSAEVVYEGLGWVGFGFSETGGMIGALTIIGLPDEEVSQTNPGKYNLEQFDISGVLLSDQQTLLSGDIQQNDTHTVLTFTKFLEEPDELAIDPSGDNFVVVAYGSSNTFAYHAGREQYTLQLGCDETGDADAGEAVAVDAGDCAGVTGFHEFDGIGITFSYELGVDEATGAGTISAEVVYEGQGWVGFGFSETGGMLGSLSVIGLPDEDVSESNPGKYLLEQFDISGIALTDQQTLMNGNIEQNDTHTILTFTKLLEEPGELAINPSGENFFVAAAGSSNEFAYHAVRERLTATLACGADAPVLPAFNVGDEVTVEGFIMDNFCIERGTLFDNPTVVTLENPEVHSVHCLIDVPQCIASDFELLLDPLPGETMFRRGLTLDDASKALIVAAAEEIGICDTCTGNRLQRGFRAIVTAEVTEEGDLATGAPPLAVASDIQPVFFFTSAATLSETTLEVGDRVTVTGFIMDNFCIERGTLLDAPSIVTLEEPNLHSVHCLIDVPQCAASNYEVLLDPAEEGDLFERGFVLDDDAKTLIRSLAMEVGVCDDCAGTGTLREGFRAQVMGTVVALGSDGEPPVISVQAATPVLPVDDAVAEDGEIDEAEAPADDEADCNTLVYDGLGLTLNYEVDEAAGIFTAEVVYEGQGWVGWAISENGAMVGSLSVIGVPDEPISENNPGKYDLAGQSVGAVTLTSQQTLTNADIVQNDTHTVLTFTKLLSEPGEIPIDPTGLNNFLVAAGTGNELGFHAVRGAAGVNLGSCGEAVQLSSARNIKKVRSHGWMMIIAWGVFVPLAIGNSLVRHLIPVQGLWFQMHRGLNSLAILLTVIAFAVIVNELNQNLPEPEHFKPQEGGGAIGKHKTIGLVVFITCIIQAAGGILRPHVPEEGQSKSTVRFLWEVVHKGSGIAILAMAWYQCHSGLVLYARIFNVDDYTDVFWGVTGSIAGIIFVGFLTRFVFKPPEAAPPVAKNNDKTDGEKGSDDSPAAAGFVTPSNIEERVQM